MNRWLAYLCLASSMALVGSYVALSKPLVAAMPVFLLAWLRFGIGGLAIVGVLWLMCLTVKCSFIVINPSNIVYNVPLGFLEKHGMLCFSTLKQLINDILI